MASNGTIWYHMVPYGTIWYHMVPYGTLWYHMVPLWYHYGTIWYHIVPLWSLGNERNVFVYIFVVVVGILWYLIEKLEKKNARQKMK